VSPLSTPTLCDIHAEDLVDTDRVIQLHLQAVATGRLTASERDRIRFVAAVEHARSVGTSDPAGLLARIVACGWWHLLTQADEDRAARRLREHLRPCPYSPARGPLRSNPIPMLVHSGPAPAIRSPYGAERPAREPSALGRLLAGLASAAGDGFISATHRSGRTSPAGG
jgi:hypothetical protein